VTKLKVVVIGGGIGGTAATLALLRAGIEVELYEQAESQKEFGAGIQISPNAARQLARYGLDEALDQCGVRPAATERRRWQDGRLLSRMPLGEFAVDAFGAPYYHVHRADLLRILGDAVPDECIYTGKRCIGITHSDGHATAQFEDGSDATAHLIVGADGIHSTVREHVAGPDKPRFSGNVAYRGLAPAERLSHLDLETVGTGWFGPGGHFVHYFVSSGRYLNFVAVTEEDTWTRESWTDPGSLEDAHRAFDGWNQQLHEIIDAVDETFKWALFDREPLPRWSKGNVTLLGDAAHAMLPYMAQGAVQSIEDGATLAVCLKNVGINGISDALTRYENLRRPRTAKVQEMSRANAIGFHLPDGPEQEKRDAALVQAAQDPLKSLEPLYGHDAENLELPSGS
jgi:2-polyprenyl-6-methoxyphenol hydroxylase-like FAD-dependent oxidoreductase